MADVVVGKNIFLYIDTSATQTPDWTLVGGQRGTSLELSADEIDCSHKTSGGWKVSKAGLRSWKFSSDAVILLDDEGLEAVEAHFIAGTSAKFRLVTQNDSGTVVAAVNGTGSVTNFSKEAPHDDVATVSIEISGNGALTQETITESGGGSGAGGENEGT